MITLKIPELDFDVQGWLEPQERHLLCALASSCQGPILEVGPWVGLSTLCIIEGIKCNTERRDFTTVDIFPTEQNFMRVYEGIGFYNDGLCLSKCSESAYEHEILPLLKKGIRKELESNLIKYKVRDNVNILEGDIRKVILPLHHFHLIFADCCHNINEFNYNFPRFKELASPECIFAIHDMHYEVPDIQILSKIGSLQVFRIK